MTPKGKNLDVALEKNQRVLDETNNDALNTIAGEEKIEIYFFISYNYRSRCLDGMISKWVGDFTWPLIRENVKYVIEVEDEEIREAMRKTFKHLKLAVTSSVLLFCSQFLSGGTFWCHCFGCSVFRTISKMEK